MRFAGLSTNIVFDQPEDISVEKVDETLQAIKFGFSEVCKAIEYYPPNRKVNISKGVISLES